MRKNNTLSYIIPVFILLIFVLGCKNMESAISSSLSDKNPEKKKKAGDYILRPC